MATAAGVDDTANVHKKARRLQELFRGRFSESEAVHIIENRNGDLLSAVDFVMQGSPEEVRQLLHGRDENFVRDLRRDSVIVGTALNLNIPFSVRQFACGPCDQSWWMKVPSRKEVATCHRCRTKYEPVPRDREWGWAEFRCVCGNTFGGFAQMGVASNCYRCNVKCPPKRILPPTKRTKPRSNAQHSCDAPDCFSHRLAMMGPGGLNRGRGARWTGVQSPYALRGQIRCCHPRSLRESGKRVLYPSQRHHSTGSTVRTFLTQDDLISVTGSFVSTLTDINEDDGSGESNVANSEGEG
ncbi:shiftless antiviral inhibitor of ribosomal frameshifting protein-like [Gigantopelta aegis]|uniref:shiftless antiviral inhibitor of ribosomal frameshifting protein-like n=1 Tax=Gigantopelta aegis TaxID=1735272 RepID=UPI001B88BA1E|nr:shiftless antiviral inhibitor of ribosomal frameshifting protein-like [Gigantopelta aegis]